MAPPLLEAYAQLLAALLPHAEQEAAASATSTPGESGDLLCWRRTGGDAAWSFQSTAGGIRSSGPLCILLQAQPTWYRWQRCATR